MTDPKPVTDWEKVEASYRAGVLSLRELSAIHGVSHVAISRRAKKEGWTRDLAAKVKAKADALVNRAAVTGGGNTLSPVTETQVVEANATAIAGVRLAHRSDIRRARDLVNALFDELSHQTTKPEVYEKLLEAITEDMPPVVRGAIEQGFRRAMAVGSRVSSVARLTEGLKNVVAMERTAWGLDEPEKKDDDLRDLTDDELLGRMAEMNERIHAAGTP